MAEENMSAPPNAAPPAFVSKKQQRRKKAKLRLMKKQASSSSHVTRHTTHDTPHAADRTLQSESRSLIKRIYEDHYKKLLWIPFILLFLALAQLWVQTAVTGDFLSKGVSINGGVTMTVPAASYDADTLKELLAQTFSTNDIEVKALSSAGEKTGLIIEADVTNEKDIEQFVSRVAKELKLQKADYSTEIIGSSLGASFFKQTITALALAFVFMAVVVIIYFRILIPSLMVILAAFGDIVVTMAIVNLLGIKISTGGIAAFLMLIGYSVDTDILLTSRVLKREGSIMGGIYSAIKTGFMTLTTTIVAVLVGLFISESEVLKQIMLIILIGLLVDTIFTWIQNAGLLRWYLERKQKEQTLTA